MNQQPVKVAVVGVGYFGSLHCQKLAALPNAQLIAVVDSDQQRAHEAAARFGTTAYSSHRDLIGLVNGAILATPASTHYRIAADLLSAGMDIFVEKPFTINLAEAEHLCRLAAERAAVLQVGHLERYHSTVAAAMHLISAPRYIHLERSGPYPNRSQDTDVVFDVMTHDLDLLLQIARSPVASCSAIGFSVVTNYFDLVSAHLEFEDGFLASLVASRIGPHKRRAFKVLDADGWLEADLMCGQITRSPIQESPCSIQTFNVPASDPLLEQDRAFIESLASRRPPLVDGVAGKSAVALAERVVASAQSNLKRK